MARTREFDPDEALAKAMRLFWQKGYHDTSMRDLVAHTGVSHAGLYSAFGSKHGLLTAALDRYQKDMMTEAIEALESPEASLPAVREHFERLFKLGRTPEFRDGCLACNCAVELASEDEAVAARVQGYLERLTGAFRGALERAKARGEVSADLDPAAMADLLAATQMSMAMLMRARWDVERIEGLARAALAQLS